MAMRPRTFGGARNTAAGRQQAAPVQRVYEDLKPRSEWIKDQESDNLLIYLPGFTKESLKVSSHGTNTLRVLGERLLTANKWQRIQEDFQVPDYCNLRGTHARFEGGILTIKVPKKTITPPPPKQETKPTQQAPSSSTISQKTHQIPKVPVPQKVQETIPPKVTSSNKEDKAKAFQGSLIPPKPVSSVPPKVPNDPMPEKIQEFIPPKITAPYQEDKAKAIQESPVSPNPISPVPSKPTPHVSDDKRRDVHALSNQEEVVEKTGVEQRQKVDSGASNHQEALRESKALHGHGEMGKEMRVPELVERRKQDSERIVGQKTEFEDGDKAKYPEKRESSSGLGNYKKAVKSIANLDEERKLLVNVGASVLVFMALGAYIYHTVT